MTASKGRQRLVGSSWIDDKGRRWDVVSMYTPGRYTIRCVHRGTLLTGEMQAAAIREKLKQRRVDREASNG